MTFPVLDNPYPNKYVLCPCCRGTGRTKPTEGYEQYKHVYAGYDAATDTLPCKNCGGQTMGGHAYGWTLPNPATQLGCKHQYTGRSGGRCYHIYTCNHCGYRYDIDSSD